MAETVRSELPNLWRSMNEPGACRYLYQICPKLKAGSRGSHGMRSSTDVSEWGRPRDFRLWHVRDVTPAATRAAAIKGAADIPARSPFKMSYTQSTFVS